LFDELQTEHSHRASVDLDLRSTEEILMLMNAADAEIAAAVKLEIPRVCAAVDAITDRLEAGGRLYYIGAGTSGRLGVLDAAECPPTFGVSRDLVRAIIAGGSRALVEAVENVEDEGNAGGRDLSDAGCSAEDAVVGIAASGRTPYVLGAIAWAREQGAVTCGISCVPKSALSAAVNFPIEAVPGPEVLAGSTRLRAGTATKMILNMISTAVMIRLGHAYGNLMVNVQPTNAKLADRARRIIRQATGVSPDRAAELFDFAGRSVRTAIVMEKKGVGRAEAERLLAQARGRIRAVLEG
jgi:N-acetylmuramic acid 6-phosphate etherase